MIDLVDSTKYQQGCPLPPDGFSKSDLSGTWYAGGPDRSDTLIIREDGTYKQIIHIGYPNKGAFDYESDWQPWWLEYAETGRPYLYMMGMRLCAYSGDDKDCETIGGGETGKWYDPCQQAWAQMSGKGVLIVMGSPRLSIQTPQPRDVSLILLRRGEDVWGYGKLRTTAPAITTPKP